MSADVAADLSGIPLAFRGLTPALAERLRREWEPYVIPALEGAPWLALTVRVAGPPAPAGPLAFGDLHSKLERGAARFACAYGSVALDEPRAGRIVLAPAEVGVQYYALLNLLAAALAFSLPSCGVALLHAAGIVLGGRGFALVGPAGAGKTTWARLARERGAVFLSDDLVLVGVATGGAEILTAPIRRDGCPPLGPRRWPLAALLLPIHGAPPRLAPVSGLRAAARVVANLPFVGESLGGDARLGGLVDRLLAAVPVYELTFAPDAAFLECLEGLDSALPRGSDGPAPG